MGYYRAGVRAPAGTPPPGSYFMRWNAIRTGSGQFGNLQPSFELVVLPQREPPAPEQPCPPPAQGGPFQLTGDPSFKATLDAQFPVDSQGKVFVSKGDSVAFGYNVRFNQVYNQQNFVLKTDTPGHINYFSSMPGDWRGTQAPNTNAVGYYRANINVLPAHRLGSTSCAGTSLTPQQGDGVDSNRPSPW